ncbi:MAG: hypothetical protein AWU55_732 [Halomonadaceae bacterium T82-2]|nr:MAG: hypothetical protein AWU55_732 [Halomonadaceae bacterium T82-2]
MPEAECDVIDRRTRQARLGVIISLIVLFCLVGLGGWQLRAGGSVGWAPILVRMLPLVLFLPSVLTRRPRGHLWLAFVSVLYLAQGITIANLPDRFWWGVLEGLAAAALGVSSLAYARWRRRQCDA